MLSERLLDYVQYDVLNQRFVTKVDKRGKQKRMLRLAIGTRSQLCPCVQGFRIIVVVGETKCYQSLDLPLLNRFEKQLFATYDLLGPNQRQAADTLQRWIEDVLHECGSSSFDTALACYDHTQTIPSLVLAASNLDDNSVPSEAVLREQLARIAFPLTVARSDLLQDAAPTYTETQGDLASAVEAVCLGSDRPSGENVLVLTRSPVGHLDVTAFEPLSDVCDASVMSIVQLTSAAQVVERVADFFEFELTTDQACLIVQCDPLHSSAVAIGHAMHIVDAMRAQYSSVGPSDVKRHVVVVMHMPPAAGADLEREFSVEFRVGWLPMTVDDLRSGSGSLVTELLSNSVHSMVVAGTLDLREALAENYQTALASCLAPSLDGIDALRQQLHSYTSRIRLMRHILEQPAFVDVLVKVMLCVLEQSATISTGIAKAGGAAAGLHKHVEHVVSGRVSAGTLRQSLQFAIDTLLADTIAFAIAELDVNFNLALYDDVRWAALSNCPAVMDLPSAALRSAHANPETVVENRGTTGPLIARCPFSWRIVKILQNVSAARTVVDGSDPVAELESLSRSVFGDEVTEMWSTLEHLDFIHDYVSMQASRFSRVELDVQLRAYTAVLRATRADAMYSPAAIHATSTNFGNEARLYRLHSILASDQVSASLADLLLSELEAIDPGSGGVDDLLVGVLLKHLWSTLSASSTATTSWLAWVDSVSALAVDVQGLLMLDDASPELSREWLSIETLHIYLTEVAQDSTWNALQAFDLAAEARKVHECHLSHKRADTWIVYGELSIGSKRAVELWIGKTVDIVEVDPRTAKQRDVYGSIQEAEDAAAPAGAVVRRLNFPVQVSKNGYNITFGDASSQLVLQDKLHKQNERVEQTMWGAIYGNHRFEQDRPQHIVAVLLNAGDQTAAVSEPEPEPEPEDEPYEWSLMAVLAAAENVDAGSAGCFRGLLVAMDTCAPSAQLVAHFARRYIDDIIRTSSVRQKQLVELLLAVVEGTPELYLGELSEGLLVALRDDLSLRRTALHCLCTTEMATVQRCAASPSLFLLMLEQEENQLSKQDAKPQAVAEAALGSSPIVRKIASMVACFPKDEVIGMFSALAGAKERVSRSDLSSAFAAFGHTVLPSDLDSLVSNDGLDIVGIQALVETLAEVAQLQSEIQADESDAAAVDTLAIQPAHEAVHIDRLAFVSAVAKLKALIRSYCAQLELQDPAAVTMQWHSVPRIVRGALVHADGPAMYALRCLHASGGIDGLANVLALPEAIAPWLPIDRAAAVPNPTLIDPFPFLDKETYSLLIAKVRDAVMVNSASTFNTIGDMLTDHSVVSAVLSRQCLLAATFSVTVADDSGLKADPPGLPRLREFLTTGMHYRREESSMLSWLAAGCTLGETSKMQHFAEQRQVCAHLAVRALAHPGSWLHCAMCTPERLNTCRIPTMPDDEFQSLLQASGDVGWYKCANGHPYSVGNVSTHAIFTTT